MRPDLRAHKKRNTRRALREAALELFCERGYAATSVDQIAAAAEVSRSTFFRYFGSKEAVLFAETDENGARFVDLLMARPASEGPIVAFEEALVELAHSAVDDDTRASSRLLEKLLSEDPALSAKRAAVRDHWTDNIATAVARRRGAEEPDARDRLAASVCVATAEAAGRIFRQDLSSVEDIIRSSFGTLRAFAAERRRTQKAG